MKTKKSLIPDEIEACCNHSSPKATRGTQLIPKKGKGSRKADKSCQRITPSRRSGRIRSIFKTGISNKPPEYIEIDDEESGRNELINHEEDAQTNLNEDESGEDEGSDEDDKTEVESKEDEGNDDDESEEEYERDDSERQLDIEYEEDEKAVADDQTLNKEKQKVQRKKKEKLCEIKATYKRIKTRSSPHMIMKALQALNDKQKSEVERIGFGEILRMDIKKLPGRMGHWVVEQYDARSSTLRIEDNVKLHITADDVYAVLGLPNTGGRIKNNKSNKDTKLLKEWRLELGKTSNRIKPIEVVEKMISCKEGGDWFIRHFVLLIISVLVDSTSHGYVNSLVMDHLRDVGKISTLNWSQYVLEKLIENKVKWDKKKEKFFCGPLLFLLVFYVDRVTVYTRDVPRRFPAILGWNTKRLKERENLEVRAGGFGTGHDDGRLSKGEREAAWNAVEDAGNAEVEEAAEKDEGAPQSLTSNKMFVKLRDVTNKMIGIKGGTGDASTAFEAGMLEDDEIYNSPEFIKAIEEAENVLIMRKKYEEMLDDVPSFSLGFTQVVDDFERETDLGNNQTDDMTDYIEPTVIVNDGRSNGGKGSNIAIKEPEQVGGAQQVGEKGKIGGKKKRKSDEKNEEKVLNNEDAGRTKRKQKCTVSMKSPYLARTINPREIPSSTEKTIWKWIVSNGNAARDEIIFQSGKLRLNRKDLMTLHDGEHISAKVIDAWSSILNHKEDFRSPTSAARFFAKTMKCVYTSGDEVQKGHNAYKLFCAALESETSTQASNADLVFFPITQLKWGYCICLNLKANRIEIIDLSSATASMDDKYEKTPINIRDMFVEYANVKGIGRKVEKLAKQKPIILRMPWRNTISIYEYGVATMRHMETYMGERVKGWDCGLAYGDPKAMNALRIKYCAAIVDAEINELKQVNITKAKEFAEG